MSSEKKRFSPFDKRYELLRSSTALGSIVENKMTQSIPCPLEIFPSKSDSISAAFFDISVPKRHRKLEGLGKWLNPEKLDPDFGIKVRCLEILTFSLILT